MKRQYITPDTQYPLLKTSIPFQPTHVLRAPPKGKEYFKPCVMELNITSDKVLQAMIEAGWEVLEVIKQS